MSSGCAAHHSEAPSSSSSTVLNARPASTDYPSGTSDITNHSHASASFPSGSFPSDDNKYESPSYEAKGKCRAAEDNALPSDDALDLSEAMSRFSLRSTLYASPASSAESSEKWLDSNSSSNVPSHTRDQPDLTYIPLLIPTSGSPSIAESLAHARHSASPPPRTDRDRRIRRGRDTTSRSVAPSPLRSALATSPTTGSASQFVSLLGQPVTVSASLSTPQKSSAAATSAVLPSLYKASRGRSTNVSPSRRWDRRGASASVLSGASASGSGGEGDEVSDGDQRVSRLQTRTSASRNAETSPPFRSRRLSVAKEEALFPSDDEESLQFSSSEGTGGQSSPDAEHRRRPRRWSSIERERRRGMRVLLREQPLVVHDSAAVEETSDETLQRRRTRSASHRSRVLEDDPSDVDVSSSLSSCSSSCDLNYVPTMSESSAIPIKERQDCTADDRIDGLQNASASVGSSQSQIPSSTDGSDDPSPAVSTPSTSLLQRSPPGFASLKPIVPIPVTTESDPLLGLATPSVEDMIQVDQVEYFPEEAISAQFSVARLKRKSSTKQSKKSSWIIGDFESEPESEDEHTCTSAPNDVVNRHATIISASSPSSLANTYQARLASLQSQLRLWSRSSGASAEPRTRQISSSSEEHAESDADVNDTDSNGASLLSASWRNLTRLPNLILLPGLAARQAKESLTSKTLGERSDGAVAEHSLTALPDSDFAQIYRVANSAQGPSDEKTLQAQRSVALRKGRPPSPSPSPSPPASLLGSRQNSSDSISTSVPRPPVPGFTGTPRRGRGVASPLDADRDPSAYVSGLGQPIDPDTELSSVVQLQTFRSRSRSRPADVRRRSGAADYPRSDAPHQYAQHGGRDETCTNLSPKKLGQPIELEPTEEETALASSQLSSKRPARPSASVDAPIEPLSVQIPKRSTAPRHLPGFNSRDAFADGPAPIDTASAPTSPTYHPSVTSSASSSADETDSVPSSPRPDAVRDIAAVDADGFRVVRRRHRRRSSGPRSLRPKVEAPVPQGFSAFAVDEGDEIAQDSGSDGEVTPSPTRAGKARGRRQRDSSPRRSMRQCAVGLFGSGVSDTLSSPSYQSSSRSGRSSRRGASHISISSPIRSVRSSPDLTYAAAAASGCVGEAGGQDQVTGEPSPPRGSRGRRGAVKVVASSVGQRLPMTQPVLLGGLEGLHRGPSYPPRAGEILDDSSGGADGAQEKSTEAQLGRGRSASNPTCPGTAPPAFRFRLLSNSSHLLMLSLELDMIKKQKISAPLKPRWGKHRANDFNPLPSTISYSSSSGLYASSRYLRSPFSVSDRVGNDSDECDGGECTACDPIMQHSPAKTNISSTRGVAATWGVGLRDPSSRLRYSWSLADIAAALDATS